MLPRKRLLSVMSANLHGSTYVPTTNSKDVLLMNKIYTFSIPAFVMIRKQSTENIAARAGVPIHLQAYRLQLIGGSPRLLSEAEYLVPQLR